MALVPVLAQCLAPGSVRYDPPNQPNNKTQTQYTKAQQRGKSLMKYALLRHCLANHINYLLMTHFNQNVRCFQLFRFAC